MNCGTCKFGRRNTPAEGETRPSFSDPRKVWCRRYPSTSVHKEDDWCGEYVKGSPPKAPSKPAAKKPAAKKASARPAKKPENASK